MNLSLEQIFGAGAIQDGVNITIKKTSLAGLIPELNNTSESLLAAIINTCHPYYEGILNAPDGSPITAPKSGPITYHKTSLYDEGILNAPDGSPITAPESGPITYDQTILYDDANIVFWAFTFLPNISRATFLFYQWVQNGD